MDNPTDLDSAHFWSYKISEKTYTPAEIDSVPYSTFQPGARRDRTILPGDTREIPIQQISPGMILYHYCTFPQRNQGETDNEYERRLFGTLLNRAHGVPAIYLPSTDRWQFCFGSTVASQQYYYTVPVAGMGIKGLGSNFNSCIISSTNRTTKWAYLKSGTTVDEKRAVHRRYPLPEYPNYDFKRLKMCNKIHDGDWRASGQCRPGREYDICITPEFQASEHIDGITCIAGEDSLVDITKDWHEEYEIDEDKSMLKNMLRWRKQIITHGNSPADHFTWAMNLLCLESDLKDTTINVGFREFSNGPMGHHHANLDHIPPSPLPVEFGVVNTDYWITEENLNAQGVCIKRVIQIKNDPALIALFISTYITPHLVVSPFIFVTPHGAIDYHAIDDKYNHPPPANIVDGCKSSREQRYMMSHHIANALYALGNGSNPPYSLLFDYRLNVFFKQGPPEATGCFDRTAPIQVQHHASPVMIDVLKIVDPENPLITEPHTNNKYKIGHYTAPFKDSTLKQCQERKILHEIISNTKWDTHWMHEFFANESANSYFIQVGPYRNPLYLPFGNKESHGDIVDIYRFIIDSLEPSVAGAIPSHTYQYINDVKVQTYIRAWATNSDDKFKRPADISRPGIEQIYHTGRWFHDIVGDRRFLGGGNRKNTRSKGGRLFHTRKRNNRNRTFLSNSNQTYRNTKMGTKSHMIHNKNKRNNTPITPSCPINNSKKQTSTRNSNKLNESNRTEKEFVPMNKDTFDSLIRVFKNKKYRMILDALHTPSSS